MMPAKNMITASALIKCIARRLKLLGLLGSFFLKKYIVQIYKKRGSWFPRPSLRVYFNWSKLFFELNTTVQYTSFFS